MATAEFPGECTDQEDAHLQDINVCVASTDTQHGSGAMKFGNSWTVDGS